MNLDTPPIVSVKGLGKHYGQVVALDGVDVAIHSGEVVALLGENGAGKSTFVSLLSGVQTPSDGTISIDGVASRFTSPADAHAAGIATVFQDLSLVPNASIVDNLFIGIERTRFGIFLDRARMRREAEAVLQRLKIQLPPISTPVRSLSGGQRQSVAVARALLRGGRVVILDEPTAALGVNETRKVLEMIRRLRDAGTAVVLVSHNMEDVFSVADRAVIFRLGRKVADLKVSQTNKIEVVGLIVGGDPSVTIAA